MTTVECYAAHGPKQPLEAWSYDIASETPQGHVDVAITHCGICHSDLHQLDDAWGIATFPLVPGHEIVGRVVAAGDGVPAELAVGTRVGIGPQRSHCKDCGSCRAKREHLCPRKGKTYAGPGKDFGGFAKFIRYPADWTFPIPEGLSSAEAAPLLCAGTWARTSEWPRRSVALLASPLVCDCSLAPFFTIPLRACVSMPFRPHTQASQRSTL
jgi:D-arabinose 1-dehydrogenase-like Zn-dependent alcohol dehydrogenase